MKMARLESSVTADKSMLQQAHPEALVAVHEVMPHLSTSKLVAMVKTRTEQVQLWRN